MKEYTEMPISFSQYLTELFDSEKPTFKWEKDSGSQMVAKFKVGNFKYQVDFDRKASKTDWEITFALTTFFDTKKMELTKTGKEFVVFANVIAAIKEFIEKHSPETMYFVADKSLPIREELYRKMLQRFKQELRGKGYDAKETSGNIHKFIITKA